MNTFFLIFVKLMVITLSVLVGIFMGTVIVYKKLINKATMAFLNKNKLIIEYKGEAIDMTVNSIYHEEGN